MPIRRRPADRSMRLSVSPTPGPPSPPRCARRSASVDTPRFSNTPRPARPPRHRRRRYARRGGVLTAPLSPSAHERRSFPRRIRLLHHLHRAPIQAPPPAPTFTAVIPGRPTPATATTTRHPASWPYPGHHQLHPVGLLLTELNPLDHSAAVDTQTADAIASHCARRCSLLRFLTSDKPETLSHNDVPALTSTTHPRIHQKSQKSRRSTGR
jgi:hypothetical protein